MNNYLATGGDGFTALTEGAAPQFGVYDFDALFAYFQANSPISPTPVDRIKRSSDAEIIGPFPRPRSTLTLAVPPAAQPHAPKGHA